MDNTFNCSQQCLVQSIPVRNINHPCLSVLKHVKCVVSIVAFSKGGVRAEGC